MPISDVVTIVVSVSGAGPTQAGFGEPLIAAYHTHYTDRVREYSSLSGMVSDGFAVTDPAYLCASEVFAQVPSPPFIKIGRRALAMTQVITLTCLSVSALDTYVFSLRSPGGTYQVVSVASTGVPATDVATINTAVTALGIPHLTATHATTILTLSMAAGFLLDVKTDPLHMTYLDTTADPGIATDMAAIYAADSNWYGLLLDSNSAAEIAAAAVWTAGNGKLFGWNSSDSGVANGASTTDIAYTEQQLGHVRSFGIYSQTTTLSYAAAAWMGRLFPTTPGSENWAFKSLVGVPVDVLTDSQVHAVEAKNASVYTAIFGLSLTQFGKLSSGQWIDIQRGTDALTNQLQVAVLALQANSKKVPFTDPGIDMYRMAIQGVLTDFVSGNFKGFLSGNPAPFVSLPLAANVNSTNKAARNLPNVTFSAVLAGAINFTTLQGTLTQ
jgi:hypothetical protein